MHRIDGNAAVRGAALVLRVQPFGGCEKDLNERLSPLVVGNQVLAPLELLWVA
jgi:hypothetical protein